MIKGFCKITLSLMIGAALMLSAAATSMAAEDEFIYSVVFNGEKLVFDQDPVNVEGRILVPMRTIFEAYGAEIQWDEAKQQVTATTVESEIILTVGSSVAYVDDAKYELDCSAMILGGRTMVPVRFVSEALRAEVIWEEATNTVSIEVDLPEVVPDAELPQQNEGADGSQPGVDAIEEISNGPGFFSDQNNISGACYLTCLGMIASNLNDEEITASDVYAINGKTVSQTNWQGLLSKLNIKRVHSLNIKSLSSNEKIIKITSLLSDNPEGVIIRLLNGSQSHYVVCRGYENGKLIVNDPVGQIYVPLGETWTGSSMFKSYDAAVSGIVLLEAYDKGDSEFSWDVLPGDDGGGDNADSDADPEKIVDESEQ